MDLRQPHMRDLGMGWEHSYPCPVCRIFHAVLNCDTGVMEPCWRCQKTGWRVMIPWTWQRRWWDRLKGKLTRKWVSELTDYMGVRCPECQGMGYDEHEGLYGPMTCDVCHGSGVAAVPSSGTDAE